MPLILMLFRRKGTNVVLGGPGDFSYRSIEIGSDVYIGPRAAFSSAISTIRIGSKVLFGPEVMIMGGDHRFDVVGKYIYDVTVKVPDNDKDVTIEDDVWIGARVVILKGVTIGRGSVVGAGSVVTKSIPPYSVAVGNPCRVIRTRFTSDAIAIHEAMLGLSGQDVRI
jgi:maltose O-acetyltransferase